MPLLLFLVNGVKNGIFYVYLQLCVNNKKGDNDMTTLELDKVRVELAREILNTDNAEMLDTVKRAMRRFNRQAEKRMIGDEQLPVCKPLQYNLEELKEVVIQSEIEIATGHTCSCEDVHKYVEQKFPFLCR